MRKGWDSGHTGLEKGHAGGPARDLSRDTRWWSDSPVSPDPSVTDRVREGRVPCVHGLLQTVDPQGLDRDRGCAQKNKQTNKQNRPNVQTAV